MKKTSDKSPIKIGLYLPHHFTLSMATLLYDYFETANALAGRKEFDIKFYAQVNNPTSYSGLTLPAETQVPRDLTALIVSGTGGQSYSHILDNLKGQDLHIQKILKSAHKNGVFLGSTCTAAYFLAKAGLLDKKSATSAWWLMDFLKTEFPQVRWNEKKSLTVQGTISTTGAGFAGLEMAKHLLSKFKMNSLERKIHRILLLPEKPVEQHPYVMLTQNISHDFSQKVNHVLEKNWEEASPELFAQHFGMSLRTFIRKFKEQMGTSPGKWIQLKRIEKAKFLLMNKTITVEEACYQSGYQDSSSFIRLFQREVGLSPREFRLSFRK